MIPSEVVINLDDSCALTGGDNPATNIGHPGNRLPAPSDPVVAERGDASIAVSPSFDSDWTVGP